MKLVLETIDAKEFTERSIFRNFDSFLDSLLFYRWS